MNTQAYLALQAERGRRGGLMAAKARKAAKAASLRALDREWPRCPECGARTHLGLCPACDGA